MKREILRLEHISKKINDVKILKNISLSLFEGEIVKLFGDEGQSKTTLVRILGGVFQPDYGKIYLDGREVEISSPFVGKKLGISIIHKGSDLIPNLTVMENLFLDRRDEDSKFFFRARQQFERTRDLLDILGLDISPNTSASRLKLEQIQLVQLGKALLDDPKVVVMDHTNILLDKKQLKLFEGVFKELAKRKVGVLVVCQNLKDFTSVSDRMYIMKDGSLIGNIVTSTLEKDKIVKMIAEDYYVSKSGVSLNEISKEVLRVENLSTGNALKNVSFSLKKGEIVSITGSYGSGKCEIGYALFGIEKITGGKIFLEDKRIKIKNPSDAIKNKIALISYEHEENGLLYNLNAKENITISGLNNISRGKIIKNELEDFLVKSVTTELGFELDEDVSVDQLSIADQRIISIARAMSSHPKVLILIDPTKGLENKSRRQILEMIVAFSNRGVSVIMISSNIHEILQISNRIMLFSQNTITGVISESELELKDQLDIFNNLI